MVTHVATPKMTIRGPTTPARPIRPGSSTGHGARGFTPRRHSLPRMGTAPIFFLVLRARDTSPTEMSESLPRQRVALCGAGVFFLVNVVDYLL